MKSLLVPALLVLFGGVALAGDPPAECGLTEERTLPAFELEDVNPNSASYGQTLTLDDYQTKVLVVYWASAT